jgi:hypothetical protein
LTGFDEFMADITSVCGRELDLIETEAVVVREIKLKPARAQEQKLLNLEAYADTDTPTDYEA